MLGNPDEKFSAVELRLMVAALSQCIGEILNKADPAFRPEILASFDAMAMRLKESGGIGADALAAIARFRQLVG